MKQKFLRGLGGLGGGEQVGEHVRNCGDDRQYDQGGRESSGISHRVTSSDDSRHEQSYPGPGSIADYRDHHGDTCDRTCERSQTQFLVDPAHGSTRTQARSRGSGVSRIQGLKNSSRRCRRAIDGSPIVRLPSVRAWLGVIP